MTSPAIPAWALGKQHQASNPSQSVWVSANAGSGKTHVLASRVIRLLLQGVAPSKILCLTFTKAAAANMAARVFDTLAKWTQLSDDVLSQKIAAVEASRPESAELTAARKLFARAVETPGGLKIQTIHAFCERLLHLFPFEANVPARFEVADDSLQAELLQRARRDVLAEANLGKGEIGAAMQRIADECGPDAFEDLIKEAMRQRAIARAAEPAELAEMLRRSLGLIEGRDVGAIEREIAEGVIAPDRWSGIAEVLGQGTKNDKTQASKFREALSHYQSVSSASSFDAFLASYQSIFFTVEGTKRATLITKDLANAYPDIEAKLRDEQQRLERLCANRKAAATFERTRALIEVTSAIFKRYGTEKAARGILDFDDLIEKTLTLLERSEARWVLYKLDAGIDHVLVDEAQDTSEDQWKILEKLTDEFATRRGHDPVRTFFAVGDEKQSIFSFQGAAPQMFDTMRRKYQAVFTASAQSFAHVPLTLSFRSAPGVLSAIDKVFEHGNHKSGLVSSGDDWMPHEACKHRMPGLVELWPIVAARPAEDSHEWTLPLDLPDEHDPVNVVAGRVAQKIAQLIDPRSNEFVHDSQTLRPRLVRPGDILILVRKRGAFFEAVIRALRKNKIPAAGADRLDLANHIAVMDLIAAGRASLLPQDDLTLASLLKSPLIGLSDDDLLALAPSRKASLFDALQASPDPSHAEAAVRLTRWRARAGGGPFAFYAGILGPDGGRRSIETRLGPEAGDAIDEFVRLAIAHEEANAPSLAAFLNDLEGLDYSVKRDMETDADAVRVMTVHAAKGLESKIVFLPDTCSVPTGRHDAKIFQLGTKVPGEKTIAWSPTKDLDCEAVAVARAKARDAATDEYRRLFYVALSRAEERLYIAGFHGATRPDDGCWAKMIEAALASDSSIEMVPAFWDSEEHVRRLTSTGSSTTAPAYLPDHQAPAPPLVLPAWLCRPVRSEANMMDPINPSNALAAESRPGGAPPMNERREALRRGRLIHLLLQYLPGIGAQQRRQAALTFLSARAPNLDETACQNLAQEALDVIALPELAGLFGPHSKAEVSIVGKVKLGARTLDVCGRVDRLGENEKEIFVADYKTGIPCALADTPAADLAQMALYHSVLTPLWPNKTLRMLLIWTAGPRLVWLPAGIFDGVLATLAAG
jgi:ATP-dependent helicase/nuclease subunit A